MISLPAALATSGAVILAWMLLMWLVSLVRRDTSIVDAAWGPGFVLVAILVGARVGPGALRVVLMVGLVALWGLRLGIHLLARNLSTGEDPRYAAWRTQHGARWGWRSLFQVFLLQGAILFLVALVFVEPMTRGTSVTPLALAGAGLALGGVAFEAAADAQLARFKRDPASRGRVMDEGLWRYSRHPNYFGESVFWWGLWLVALGVGGAWWTVVSPVLMTFLLLKVSGVPMLEKRLESTRPGYREYAQRTSAFVPLPPRGRAP